MGTVRGKNYILGGSLDGLSIEDISWVVTEAEQFWHRNYGSLPYPDSLYSVKEMRGIAKILGIDKSSELVKLRARLRLEAAEYLVRVGLSNSRPPNQKTRDNYLNKIQPKLKKLLESFEADDGAMLLPSSGTSVDSLRPIEFELYRKLRSYNHQISQTLDNQKVRGPKPETQARKEYVMNLTRAFSDFANGKKPTRTVAPEHDGSYGPYPDFIRAACAPVLGLGVNLETPMKYAVTKLKSVP